MEDAMFKTVFKYPLPMRGNPIQMPKGARVLSLQVQYGDPQLWALVDPEAPEEPRQFRIFGTGHPMTITGGHTLEFIDTFQLDGGQLVFHVFEEVGS
jgi:hypothetical protein